MTRSMTCTWYNKNVKGYEYICGRRRRRIQVRVGRDSPSPNILAAAICRPRELPGGPLGGALMKGFIAFVFTPPPGGKEGLAGTTGEVLEPLDIGVAGSELGEDEGDCTGATELSLSPDGIAGADVYVTLGSVYSWDVFCFLVFLGGGSRGEAG